MAFKLNPLTGKFDLVISDHTSLTSVGTNTHTTIDSFISSKAVANGLASLDAAGKVPSNQLPNSILEYMGTWNASTNTPTLADGTVANAGNVYRVSDAGTQDLGSGSITFVVGDYVICNHLGTWEKSDTTDAVASVDGRTGTVTLSDLYTPIAHATAVTGIHGLSNAGSYTLTIPATGTAALLGVANAFTANQTIAGNVIAGSIIDSGSRFHAVGTTADTAAFWGTSYNSTTSAPQFALRHARGTEASPEAILSGDGLGAISYRGYTGSAFTGSKGYIVCRATEDWSPTANGTLIAIQTTANGGTSASDKLTIGNDGHLTSVDTAPTFGSYTLTIPATGTAALLGTANVFTAIQQTKATNTSYEWQGTVYSTSNFAGAFVGQRARGTEGSEGVVANNDILLTATGRGWDSTAFRSGAAFQFVAAGTWSTTSWPTKWNLLLTPASSTTAVTVMSVQSNGWVGIGTTEPEGSLDVRSGVTSLLLGADNNAYTLTDATQKSARQGFHHYTNAEEPVATFIQTSTSVANTIAFGGGTATMNSATLLVFYTGATNTTTTGTEKMRIDSAGNVMINDSANTQTSLGLTINQGGYDDEIFTLKSSDVNHGITDFTETDTYFSIRKLSAAAGGGGLYGFSEATVAVSFTGMGVTDNTAKTTAARAYVENVAYKKSGTGYGAAGADANLMVISNAGTARFIFDAEGSAHGDIEFTTFDKYDDLALLNALSHEFERRKPDPVKYEFGHFLKEHKKQLQEANIVNFYDDGPRAMVNFTRLNMLMVGALRQLGRKVNKYEEIFKQLGVDQKLLGEAI